MASFDSTLYALQKPDRANLTRLANPNQASGRVEYTRITYTIPASSAPATSDTLNLCELPPGVVPLPELSSVVCSADPGTTLVVDIGTASDLDGWADGMVLSSGGQVWAMAPVVPAWYADFPLVADTGATNATVICTFASVSTLTAAVVLSFNLAWRRNA